MLGEGGGITSRLFNTQGEMLLELIDSTSTTSSPWTAEGVFTRAGVMINGCKYIDKRTGDSSKRYDESDKYGFYEGTPAEVTGKGYKPVSEVIEQQNRSCTIM